MDQQNRDRRQVVVDGSNIATEGRTTPSLAQLDEAIRSFLEEYPGFTSSDVIVVVDATFGHRIDASELAAFEQAVDHSEMITPPAGAIGRGDGFILRIAEKSGALVLSNDSFQEFHAERPWLFEPGRLIGGKPVPGVGWVFTPRTPVRGARSRSVTSKAKRDGVVDPLDQEPSAPTPSGRSTKAAKAPASERPGRATKATKAAKAAKVGAESLSDQNDEADRSDKANKVGKTDKAGKATKKAAAAADKAADKAAKAAKATKAAKKSSPSKRAAKDAAGGGSDDDAAPVAKKRTRSTAAKKAAAEESGASSPAGSLKAGVRSSGGSPDAKEAEAAPRKSAKKSAKKSAEAPSGSADDRGGTNDALNDPVSFLNFVADHPVGSTFEGTVTAFTSHGAHVAVDGMLCHIPLRGLASPPPNRARQVLTKGESRPFVLISLDAARRRAELALPGVRD
jgi:hypothetical protein